MLVCGPCQALEKRLERHFLGAFAEQVLVAAEADPGPHRIISSVSRALFETALEPGFEKPSVDATRNDVQIVHEQRMQGQNDGETILAG